jgi:hypothetical protein
MHLLIDGQAIQGEGKLRGIGRYSRELLEGITRVRPAWKITVAASDHLGSIETPESVEVIRYYPPADVHFCSGSSTNFLRLHYADWLRAQKADAILVLSVFEGWGLPVNFLGEGPPLAGVFYDLIPLLFADRYLTGHPLPIKYYSRQLRSLVNFDGLLAISETTKRDLLSVVGYRGRTINIQGAPADDFEPTSREIARSNAVKLFQSHRLVGRPSSDSPASTCCPPVGDCRPYASHRARDLNAENFGIGLRHSGVLLRLRER